MCQNDKECVLYNIGSFSHSDTYKSYTYLQIICSHDTLCLYLYYVSILILYRDERNEYPLVLSSENILPFYHLAY